MKRALCIGECMVQLRAEGPELYRRSFAGDAYNTAVYLKRSAPALAVEFCTATGQDPLSASMRADMAAEEIGTRYAFSVPDRLPGLYVIDTDTKGERRFHYWRGESAARRWWRCLKAQGAADVLREADLLYFSGIGLAILQAAERSEALEQLRAVRGRTNMIAFDVNVRPSLWTSINETRMVVEEAIAIADIVHASCQDLDLLYGTADPRTQIERLVALGGREIAVTSDTDGCWLYDGDSTLLVAPVPPARVVDTSGAGDAFNGAYLAARLQSKPPREAAESGLQLASLVVAEPGAIIARANPHPGKGKHA